MRPLAHAGPGLPLMPPHDRSLSAAWRDVRAHAAALRNALAPVRRAFARLPSAAWVLVAAAAVLIVHELNVRRALDALDALRAAAASSAPAPARTLLPLEKSAFAQAGPVAGSWPQASPIQPAVVDDGLHGLENTGAPVPPATLADGWRASPQRAARWAAAAQQLDSSAASPPLRHAGMAPATDALRSRHQAVGDALQASRLAVAVLALTAALVALALLQRGADARAAERSLRDALQAQREQLQHATAERTRELTELARHLHSVREDERRRLARDLHDELGALLAAAKLTAASLTQRLGARAADHELHQQLQQLSRSLDDGIRLKRRIIEDLHPSTLDHLGLPAALEIQAREFAQRAELQVRTRLQPVVLSPSAQMTAYRLVQEALTNIAKYARAHSVQVTLADDGDAASVCVEDDGCGFDPGRARPSAHGLMGMRYRVEAEGGSLQIASAPGRGTRIAARLPAHAA